MTGEFEILHFHHGIRTPFCANGTAHCEIESVIDVLEVI